MKKITRMQYLSLLWIARILGMFYIVLLGLFSLKAIQPGVAFWDNFVVLLLNLIPFLLVLLVLIVGWRKILITGIGLILISLAYLYFFNTELVDKLIAIGPGVLDGMLFIVVFYIKPEISQTSPHEKTASTESQKV